MFCSPDSSNLLISTSVLASLPALLLSQPVLLTCRNASHWRASSCSHTLGTACQLLGLCVPVVGSNCSCTSEPQTARPVLIQFFHNHHTCQPAACFYCTSCGIGHFGNSIHSTCCLTICLDGRLVPGETEHLPLLGECCRPAVWLPSLQQSSIVGSACRPLSLPCLLSVRADLLQEEKHTSLLITVG
jgi:hypothetical protein